MSLQTAYDYAWQACETDRSSEHLRQLGASARSLGRVDEAITHLVEAEGLARAEGDTWELATVLNWLGFALAERGQWPEAMRAYNEGLTLTAGPMLRRLHAGILQNRAELHQFIGDLDASAADYQAAIPVFEGHDDTLALAGAYADLAMVYQKLGDVEKAKPLAERALAVERERGYLRGVVLDLNLLAGLQLVAPVAVTYSIQQGIHFAG